MAVEAINTDIVATKGASPSKSSSSNMSNIPVFLCIAQAMKSNIDGFLKTLNGMDKDAREKEAIQNALNLAKGLGVTKDIIDSLIQAAKESDNTELVNWLEGLKNNVNNLIKKRNTAIEERKKAREEVKANKDIFERLKLDIGINDKAQKYNAKEFHIHKSWGTKIVCGLAYLGENFTKGIEEYLLYDPNGRAMASVLNTEPFKDICGNGKATDKYTIIDGIETVILGTPIFWPLLIADIIWHFVSPKKDLYYYQHKLGNYLDKNVFAPARKPIIKELKQDKKLTNSSDPNKQFDGHVQQFFDGAAYSFADTTDPKYEAFQATSDKDEASAKSYDNKVDRLDSTGLKIVQNQAKETSNAQTEILNKQKVQNDIKITINQIIEESKVLNEISK